MSEFLKNRLQLTFWYTLVVMIISFTLSGLYYRQTLRIIDFQYGRIEIRLRNNDQYFMQMPPPPRPRAEILRTELAHVEEQLGRQLLLINGIVLLVGAGASYFLSGKTLKPIHLALQQQQRFVADAAHELRTPLTAMKTSLEVALMDKKTSKKAQDVLNDNLQDVTSLEALTNHLLTLARSEDQTHQHFAKVSLNEVVFRARKHLEPLAKKKQVKIVIKEVSRIAVCGDNESLFEVCMILLDNAIKFSPTNGTVTVKIYSSKHHGIVQVTDNGSGISRNDLPHIFERFYRVEKSRQRQSPGGYGLGLAVAKKIADQHHGSITVKSEPAQGSTFCFFVPLSS